MKLDSDFEFRPLPPIEHKGGVSAEVAVNPLGRLAGLEGSWAGTGFNVIWRPNSTPASDRFLELNRTSEKITFERIPGEIPNRGFLQPDITMFGLSYLQQITDRNLDNAGLHFEPGIWAHVPHTTNPHEPVTVVRMASIPHGTTIVAQGLSTEGPGKPVIPNVSIKPFGIGDPTGTIDFPEQDLTASTPFRTAGPGLAGITQAMVNNPNTLLQKAIASQNFDSTIKLAISTLGKPVLGGGTANTAFLKGGADGPNAVAASVTATFWLGSLHGQPVHSQLQYTQTVLLNFNGISWPHVTVATLNRVV